MAEYNNPYVAGAPVTDQRMFFGREDVFTWIEQNIEGQLSDNMLVIHGQRRVGKTSVLKQLGNYISNQYIPVFFDLQGRTHTTINKFLYRLAREIVRTLTRKLMKKFSRSIPKRARAKAGLCESLIALGDAARKLDDLADAKERYLDFLKIDTDNLEAKERLAALAISQAMLWVLKRSGKLPERTFWKRRNIFRKRYENAKGQKRSLTKFNSKRSMNWKRPLYP